MCLVQEQRQQASPWYMDSCSCWSTKRSQEEIKHVVGRNWSPLHAGQEPHALHGCCGAWDTLTWSPPTCPTKQLRTLNSETILFPRWRNRGPKKWSEISRQTDQIINKDEFKGTLCKLEEPDSFTKAKGRVIPLYIPLNPLPETCSNWFWSWVFWPGNNLKTWKEA